MSSGRLLTAEQVAETLSVPLGWVREHTRSGEIPCVRLGKYRRYEPEAVLAWVGEQASGGSAWRKHQPVAPRPKGDGSVG